MTSELSACIALCTGTAPGAGTEGKFVSSTAADEWCPGIRKFRKLAQCYANVVRHMRIQLDEQKAAIGNMCDDLLKDLAAHNDKAFVYKACDHFERILQDFVNQCCVGSGWGSNAEPKKLENVNTRPDGCQKTGQLKPENASNLSRGFENKANGEMSVKVEVNPPIGDRVLVGRMISFHKTDKMAKCVETCDSCCMSSECKCLSLCIWPMLFTCVWSQLCLSYTKYGGHMKKRLLSQCAYSPVLPDMSQRNVPRGRHELYDLFKTYTSLGVRMDTRMDLPNRLSPVTIEPHLRFLSHTTHESRNKAIMGNGCIMNTINCQCAGFWERIPSEILPYYPKLPSDLSIAPKDDNVAPLNNRITVTCKGNNATSDAAKVDPSADNKSDALAPGAAISSNNIANANSGGGSGGGAVAAFDLQHNEEGASDGDITALWKQILAMHKDCNYTTLDAFLDLDSQCKFLTKDDRRLLLHGLWKEMTDRVLDVDTLMLDVHQKIRGKRSCVVGLLLVLLGLLVLATIFGSVYVSVR